MCGIRPLSDKILSTIMFKCHCQINRTIPKAVSWVEKLHQIHIKVWPVYLRSITAGGYVDYVSRGSIYGCVGCLVRPYGTVCGNMICV